MTLRIALLLLSFALPLAAQEPASPVLSEPSEPTEPAQRPPASPAAPAPDGARSVTVLGAETVDLAGRVSLPDLLLTAGGGLHVYDPTATESGNAVDLRGFYSAGTSRYLRLVVDGLPVHDFDTDAIDWNLVDLDRVERIEVTRGPAEAGSAGAGGFGGIGGIVNVITRRPTGGPEGRVVLATGNEGLGEGSLAAGWSGARSAADVSLHRLSLSGLRAHSIYHGTQAQSKLHWTPRLGPAVATAAVDPAAEPRREIGLVLSGLYLDSDREIPGGLPAGTPSTEAGSPLDADVARTWQAALRLNLPLGGESAFDAAIGLRGKKQDRTDTIAFETLTHGIVTRSGRGELRYQRGFDLAGHHGRLDAGGEGSHGWIDSDYFTLNAVGDLRARIDRARATRSAGGAFAGVQLDLGHAVSLSLRLRHDELRGSFTGLVPLPDTRQRMTSPALGLSWRVSDSAGAFLAAGRAYQAPSVEQLYDRRPFIIGRGIPPAHFANPALAPERATYVEAGFDSRLGNHAATSLAVYAMNVTDEIRLDFSRLQLENLTRSRRQGLEWNLTSDPTPGLRPRLSYTYTRAVFAGGGNDGNQVNGVPRTQLVAALGWTGYSNGGTGPFGELALSHLNGQFLDEENRLPLAASTILGGVLGVHFEKLSFDVTVRNLLNHKYDADGFVTLDTRGKALALYYPGSERTVVARLRIDF